MTNKVCGQQEKIEKGGAGQKRVSQVARIEQRNSSAPLGSRVDKLKEVKEEPQAMGSHNLLFKISLEVWIFHFSSFEGIRHNVRLLEDASFCTDSLGYSPSNSISKFN